MKKLARIKNVHFGVGDYGEVALWFDAYISESTAALQVLSVENAVELIKSADVQDVQDLAGKNIWVEENGNMIIYHSYAKI